MTSFRKIRSAYGVFRSWLIYYGKPGNRKRLRSFYGQFISKGDLCFDIGAHLGNRSAVFLDLECEVVALEPQPKIAGFLASKLTDHESFTLLSKAIGAEPGTATMHISSANPTISTLSSRPWRDMMNAYERIPTKWDQSTEVEVTTLDALIDEYGRPKFIKLDVEGFEEEALKGLSAPVDFLSVEFIGADTRRTIRCVELLKNIGSYHFNLSMGESQQWYWPEWKPAKAVVEELGKFDRNVRSGDLYARLKDE